MQESQPLRSIGLALTRDGHPYCRDCGRPTFRVERDIRPGWPQGGFVCICGWAITDPVRMEAL
jgi:ribosomal protein L37E